MALEIRRIILFAQQMNAMAALYGQELGLQQRANEPRWKDFDTGDYLGSPCLS